MRRREHRVSMASNLRDTATTRSLASPTHHREMRDSHAARRCDDTVRADRPREGGQLESVLLGRARALAHVRPPQGVCSRVLVLSSVSFVVVVVLSSVAVGSALPRASRCDAWAPPPESPPFRRISSRAARVHPPSRSQPNARAFLCLPHGGPTKRGWCC